MCGILGAWWRDAPPEIETRFPAILTSLAHRGPDDRGQVFDRMPQRTVALGHTRLSIIDLSAGGHQPMHSPDGRYVIVFNGEIYNYKELRTELRLAGFEFRSDSDTEVLLCAWAYWGKSCLTRLIGMFAFAVYDKTEQAMTLVRDAFGIKPLFFSHGKDRFLFGSEMPSLLALGGQPLQLNPQRAYDYLIHGVQDTGFDTFVRGVSHVPPAYLVRYDLVNPDKFESERWWNPDIALTSQLSFEEAAEALRELFLQSVKLHLRSDVPLGVALSGGIDSSSLVCAMRHLEPEMPIHTFSYTSSDPAFSEERWIDIVNTHVGAEAHKVYVNPGDLANDLSDLIQAQGEPFCTTSMYAQYRVFQKAREDGITVVLEGQGGDELLAGYHGYQGQRMRSLWEQGEWSAMQRFARQWLQWPGREHLSPWRAWVGQLLPDGLYQFAERVARLRPLPDWMDKEALKRLGVQAHPFRLGRIPEAKGRRVMEVLFRAMSEGGLPSLLRYGDRNAMRFSIENRVPFLTLPLADFVLSLPEHYLIAENGETKSLFRAAMRGIVPNALLDRRDKIGFETPVGNLVAGLVAEGFKPDALGEQGLVDEVRTREHLNDRCRNPVRFTAQDWRLVNLSLWMQTFLKGVLNSEPV